MKNVDIIGRALVQREMILSKPWNGRNSELYWKVFGAWINHACFGRKKLEQAVSGSMSEFYDVFIPLPCFIRT